MKAGSTHITLIDYGAGNLRSVQKALETAGGQVQMTSDPQVVAGASKLVLPGVGAFGDGMRGLQQSGLDDALKEAVGREVPVLGICLGMQLLFEWSEELGQHRGLGLLPGGVRRFDFAGAAAQALKIPHTGWNQLLLRRADRLLKGIDPGDYVYFNHSFYCDPSQAEDGLADCEYGVRFTAAVSRGRLWGAQFHPEKSQAVGLQLLKNFVEVS